MAWSSSWGGFWALLRYADVKRAAADFKTFITSVQNVVPKVAFTGRRPPLHLDPPEHTPYRRALNPLLSAERVAALEPTVRRIVIELLTPLIERGSGDICTDFSSHLPVRVFAEWMNLPSDQALQLARSGRAFNLAVQDQDDELVKQISLQLYEMARGLIADRRAHPRDPLQDPTSALLAARQDDQPLPDEMIIATIRQVLVVGIIAPTIVIGSIAVHLCRHPDLQRRLRAEPALIPTALEELLRLYTPYRGFARTVSRPLECHGETLQLREPIALVYASANRDETVFERPDEFDLSRPNLREHLAFGHGPHHCPGAGLARLQLRVTLEELLARTRELQLVGPIKPTRCPEIGALSVPVTFLR
ncbi:MAG TPA: cytochrome P450 [Steroidobacteraceae bacterium]|nr:cytochrome P450 [Steroidobacteraceae bacterium]